MAHYTIDCDEEAERGLERDRLQLGMSTNAQVIRRALDLLHFVLEEQREGAKLILENTATNGRKEVKIL